MEARQIALKDAVELLDAFCETIIGKTKNNKTPIQLQLSAFDLDINTFIDSNTIR